MCLHLEKRLRNNDSIRAGKDINCYKVIVKRKYSFGSFYETPFAHNRLDEEFILSGKCTFDAPSWQRNLRCGSSEVGNGWIHTYETYEHAKEMADYLRMFFDEAIIYKCVIPKGTNYFKGKDDNGFPSYASECIRFFEKVKEK